MHRFLLSLGVAVATTIWSSSAAIADTSGAAKTDAAGAEASASTNASSPRSGGGSSSEQCEYRALPIASDVPVYDEDGVPIQVDGTGIWYEKWCGTNFYGAVYLSPTSPSDLLDEARRRITVPLPEPRLSPGGEQLVNLPTWLWLDQASWAQHEATAAVPGLSVTVTAVPELTVWTMGDGSAVTCVGPGVSFDPNSSAAAQVSNCLHIYTRSSARQPDNAFEASVTVRWRLAWTVAGGAGGGDLGTIDRTTGFVVPVAEIQTVNVNQRGNP